MSFGSIEHFIGGRFVGPGGERITIGSPWTVPNAIAMGDPMILKPSELTRPPSKSTITYLSG